MTNAHNSPVPNDSCPQVSAIFYADHLARRDNIRTVLDLGFGANSSRRFFQIIRPEIRWFGVDIPCSREMSARTETERIVIYDGVQTPFKNAEFDLVYSRQVMEHVRYPEDVLNEVQRLLRSGGHFMGSTSHLEPYHSNSYWNYTPWGFCRLLEDADFRVVEIRPGIDGLTLMLRHMMGKRTWFDRYFGRESPLNSIIGLVGRLGRKSPRIINHAKLAYCGHFVFWAVKPDE